MSAPLVSARRSAACFATALSCLLLSPNPGNARPNIRLSFFNAYPGAVGSRLDNLPTHAGHCGVCHLDFNGGGTRNPYGARVEAMIPGYPNNDNGRKQAIHFIENEDSDGDGFSALVEITNTTTYANTPTFPGLSPANVAGVTNVNVNEILGHLVPVTQVDTTPPSVTVTAPDGGENWTGGTMHAITWTATDNVGVTTLDVFYRDSESAPWTMVGRNLSNSGTFTWPVPNTPGAANRVRVLARDAAANSGEDMSNALFAITATPGGRAPTTLRDFKQPGTQPFDLTAFDDHSVCMNCHGNYNAAVEPGHNFEGSMMAQAARDPLFFACLTVAEQDAPGSGDLCLRCHTPFGWMLGRSNPTSGALLQASDLDGVSCDFCHRAVDPVYTPGTSPLEDVAVLAGLASVPAGHANGQYVVDPNARKRGPFSDPITPHAFLSSTFHRSSDICGTCHDVSNPAFDRVAGDDYAPNAFDQPPAAVSSSLNFPLERTYSEWKHSSFVAGVYAPEFAGTKPDGVVSTCQDCHMRDVTGKGCNDPAAPTRQNLPLHDLTGGNAWMPLVVAAEYPGETNATALADAAARATGLLQKAAVLALDVTAEGDSFRASVTVTNRTGHKLPTGYPEGRRMWLHLVARDGDGAVVYESGGYDPATGILIHDADLVVYEAKLGVSPALAPVLGLTGGPSFHFALNDTLYGDNRIPPLGFTNAAFEAFGGRPVDPGHPGPRYADGQNWDTSEWLLPGTTRRVVAELHYQTTSKEYVEFLRDENHTDSRGTDLHAIWTTHDRATPVRMAADSVNVEPSAVPTDVVDDQLRAMPRNTPFRGQLEIELSLTRPAAVEWQVIDVRGRLVTRTDYGVIGGGASRLAWNGRDAQGRDVGSGIFWSRVRIGDRTFLHKVVRLR